MLRWRGVRGGLLPLFPRAHSARRGVSFHGNGAPGAQPFPESLFDGDENAIVDFKYSSSPRVTWWFDHHQSAFLTPADAEHFRQDRSGHKFYDPEYKSCTKLLADVTSEQFGFDVKPLAELIHWGDIIDGAQYPTPESAVAIAEPATKLALVIESAPEEGLVSKIIPDLSMRPLAEMIELPIIAKHLGPLLERHRQSIDLLKQRIEVRGGVLYFDITDLPIDGYNKFIPYMLYPDARYTVSVLASPSRAKISIGSNPWNPDRRRRQSGKPGRAIRRRRASARRRHFAGPERGRARQTSRARKSPKNCAIKFF